MARRDFAEVQAPQAEDKETGSVRRMITVVGLLAIMVASFTGGFMLGRDHEQQKSDQVDKQHLLEQVNKQKSELEALRKMLRRRTVTRNQAATQVGELTFYNTLPKQKVTPAPLSSGRSSGSSGTARPPTGDHRSVVESVIRRELSQGRRPQPSPAEYRLQVGSYQRKADAERLKAQMDQAGFASTVQETQVPELGVWYRVFTGPYAGRAEVEKARQQVQAKMHIIGLVLHDR